MTKKELNEIKSQLVLLDENDIDHHIYCHKNNHYFEQPTFTCSDADREVKFQYGD
jgi:hypothetical protein